jgi:hypothetical protein
MAQNPTRQVHALLGAYTDRQPFCLITSIEPIMTKFHPKRKDNLQKHQCLPSTLITIKGLVILILMALPHHRIRIVREECL